MSAQNQVGIVDAQFCSGVCYGRKGDNLPLPSQVVAMYKKYGIESMRLFDPNVNVLTALKGNQIQVTLGVPNQDLPNLVMIGAWYNRYVTDFPDVPIVFIAIGNEAIPWQFSLYVVPVMQNFQTIIAGSNATGIGVTTAASMKVMGTAFPPTTGAFKGEASRVMAHVLEFLASHNYPLMLNAYSYFPYALHFKDVSLAYAQFTASAPVVHDSRLDYWNLLDAMVDAVYAAMEKVAGMSNVNVIVSETGWPSAGNGNFTTASLSETYNQNLLKRFKSGKGTPRKPSINMSSFW